MWGRRIVYLTVLGCCLVFYIAYREWLAWFLLLCAVGLPWLSLGVSLPAMLTTRLTVQCPAWVTVGEPAQLTLQAACPLPEPPVQQKLQAIHRITGERRKLRYGDPLPTSHCGAVYAEPVRAWVFDYLGLFRLPVRKTEGCTLLVRPRRQPMTAAPDLNRYRAMAWKPRPGGGFAENHELRLYRPGDDLRQVHWKLSAKTGKLILREPMEPMRGLAVLTMVLSGSPEELDEKLGRLLWLSEYLLRQEVPHQIRCLTGAGLEAFPVKDPEEAMQAVDSLLSSPQAPAGAVFPPFRAAWRYHVGEDGHEG